MKPIRLDRQDADKLRAILARETARPTGALAAELRAAYDAFTPKYKRRAVAAADIARRRQLLDLMED